MVKGRRSVDESDVSDDDAISDADSNDSSRARPPKKKIAKKEKRPTTPRIAKKPDTSAKRKSNAFVAGDDGAASSSGEEGDDSQLRHFELDPNNLLKIEVPPPPAPIMAQDGTGMRLLIKSIEVENFKSYYGKRTIGPFHQRFTAIIGPNGSGKSNVIDALLFVFGCKATRIRSKKLSVLIHSSAEHPDVQSCLVRINFVMIKDVDNDSYEEVPGSEFWVSRSATKTGASEYRMNGKKHSFKELADKFRDVGIDLVHNRFLILQGEVEQIAMMKPKKDKEGGQEGMLEYLEDIVGSSRFMNYIDAIVKKIAELEAKKQHANEKTTEAMKAVDELEGPAQEQINFMHLENGIFCLHAKKAFKKKYHTEHKLEDAEPDREKAESDLNAFREESDAVMEKLAELKKAEEEGIKAMDELSREVEQAEKALRDANTAEQKNENDKKRCEKEVTKLEKDLKKERAKLKEEQEKPEDAQKKADLVQLQLDEYRAAAEEAQEKYDEIFPKFTKKTDALRAQKAPLEEEHTEKSKKHADIQGELLVTEAKLKNMSADYEKQKATVSKAEADITAYKDKIVGKMGEFEAARTRKTGAEAEAVDVRKNIENLKQRNADIDKEISKLQTVADKMNEGKQRQSSDQIVAALSRERDSGRIQGYNGRLGDLGGIDAKYDCAISTACSYLDHHVTKDCDTATACTAFLNKNQLGTGKFMMLDKMDKDMRTHAAERFVAPAGAKRLFDLIECDDKYKYAFYFGIRNTVVCETVDRAREIYNEQKAERVQAMRDRRRPPHSFRVVTVDGELFDPSGCISGGGQPIKGRMGTARRNSLGSKADPKTAQEAAEAAKKIEALNEEATEIVKGLSEAQRRLHELTTSIREDDKTATRAEVELKQLSSRLATLESSMASLRATLDKTKVDEKEVQRLEQEREKLQEEFESSREEKCAAEDAVKEVDKQIKSVKDKMLKPHEDSLNKAKKDLATAEEEITKAKADVASAPRNIEKQQKKVTDLEEKEVMVKKEIDECDAKAEELKETKEKMSEAKQKKELEHVKADEEMKKLRAEKNELDKKEMEFMRTKLKLEDRLKAVTDTIRGFEHIIKEQNKEIANLTKKLHNIANLESQMPSTISLGGTLDFFWTQDETLMKARQSLSATDSSMKDAVDSKERDELAKGSMPMYSKEQIDAMEFDKIDVLLDSQEEERKIKKKAYNPDFIARYSEKVKRANEENAKLEEITKNTAAHVEKMNELKKQRLYEFQSGFETIRLLLREMYQKITLGGDAALEPKDQLDPFVDGVQFMVRPPKKSWKRMENLSGGEKTLSSLALVFALHKYRPTPLYVMDEIDAALDFRNVSIIGHYIRENAKNAQFVVITLRNNMFELAERLVGIYKTHNATKNIVIDPMKIIAMLEKEEKNGRTALRDLNGSMAAITTS